MVENIINSHETMIEVKQRLRKFGDFLVKFLNVNSVLVVDTDAVINNFVDLGPCYEMSICVDTNDKTLYPYMILPLEFLMSDKWHEDYDIVWLNDMPLSEYKQSLED